MLLSKLKAASGYRVLKHSKHLTFSIELIWVYIFKLRNQIVQKVINEREKHFRRNGFFRKLRKTLKIKVNMDQGLQQKAYRKMNLRQGNNIFDKTDFTRNSY